jgi:hypothetical protein
MWRRSVGVDFLLYFLAAVTLLLSVLLAFLLRRCDLLLHPVLHLAPLLESDVVWLLCVISWVTAIRSSTWCAPAIRGSATQSGTANSSALLRV